MTTGRPVPPVDWVYDEHLGVGVYLVLLPVLAFVAWYVAGRAAAFVVYCAALAIVAAALAWTKVGPRASVIRVPGERARRLRR